MGTRIAVGGKGGVGKTTLAALIVRNLLKAGKNPVLAVDADPNTNLPEALGVQADVTVGSIIASFIDEKISIPQGMTKESFLQVKMHSAVAESKGLDLVAMGRGEGPGCYCYPNLILRGFVEDLSGNYPFVVIDNEAGMEHLSRRTSETIDQMILVSDPSIRGLRSARRIHDLIRELNLDVATISLAIVRAPDPLPPALLEESEKLDIPLAGTIPQDDLIADFDLEQKPLTELPDDSPAVAAARGIMETMKILG